MLFWTSYQLSIVVLVSLGLFSPYVQTLRPARPRGLNLVIFQKIVPAEGRFTFDSTEDLRLAYPLDVRTYVLYEVPSLHPRKAPT